MTASPRSSHSHQLRRHLGAASAALVVAVLAAASGHVGATTVPPADGAAAEPEADIDRTDWPETLTIGAVPSEESTSLDASFGQVISLLEEGLGVDIEFFQATDYAGIVEAQIAGSVDLAQYGPFSYIIAVTNGAEIEPVGAQISGEGVEPGYQSFGITTAENAEIDSLEDFAGKNVCFVDPSSTSGYLYPSAGLLDVGVDPESDVTPVFAGGHDASVLSVVNGDCDAGFAYDTMVESQLIDSGDIAQGDVKIVWESEIIAGAPIAVRTELPQSMRDEIARIINTEANVGYLTDAGTCSDPATADSTAPAVTASDLAPCELPDGVWGFASVDDAFYDGVRAVCDTTQAEACEA